MVVTQEWNQALDSDSEPYVRHGGREGLPAVWCMGRTNGSFRDRTPPVWDGRRDGWWCGMRSCVDGVVCVFLVKECSLDRRCLWCGMLVLVQECRVGVETTLRPLWMDCSCRACNFDVGQRSE